MIHEEIEIRSFDQEITCKMYSYLIEKFDFAASRKRPAVIICPGGGYEHLSDREGEPVALKLMSMGYQAFVLKYSIEDEKFPIQVTQAAYALNYVRTHSEEWGIDPDRIIIGGFSAGGHVAACLGTMWQEEWLEKLMGIEKEMYKPNGLMLAYPVITSGEHCHEGSFYHLTGLDRNDEIVMGDHYRFSAEQTEIKKIRKYVSLENRVTKDVPPAFIWHTFEDRAVPLENTLYFANALRKAGIQFEYHVFPVGHHGLALATKETNDLEDTCIVPECQPWIDLFETWLNNLR